LSIKPLFRDSDYTTTENVATRIELQMGLSVIDVTKRFGTTSTGASSSGEE
jgi:hypothetical protein